MATYLAADYKFPPEKYACAHNRPFTSLFRNESKLNIERNYDLASRARVWHAKRNKIKDVISRLLDVILQLPAVIIRLFQKSLFYVLKSQRCFQTPESGHGM